MHGWWYGSYGWLGMIIGTVVMLAVLVGLVLLVVWAVRHVSRNSAGSYYMPASQNQPSAKEVLQIRYARGEITREQYQQMLSEIER